MRFILLSFLLLSSIVSHTQATDDRERSHELGINFFNTMNFGLNSNSRTLLPGIYYRKILGRGMVRISYEVSQKFHTSGPYNPDILTPGSFAPLYVSSSDSVHWKQNTYDGRVGVGLVLKEWKKLQAFVFSDLFVQVQQTDGWYKVRFNPNDTILHPRNARGNYLGTSLGVGIRLRLSNALMFTFETDVAGSIGWTKIEQKNLYIAPETNLDFHFIRTLGLAWTF